MPKKKAVLPPEEEKRLIEEVEKEVGYRICGYISYDENNNLKICKKPAGWGTAHAGQGKCRLHGGVGRPVTSGKWVTYRNSDVKTIFERVKEYEDVLVKDHQESLKIVYALFNILDEVVRSGRVDVTTIEAIRRVLETKIKIEELELRRKKLEESTFTEEEVLVLVRRIFEIIEECVSSIEEKRKIFTRIANLSFFKRKGKEDGMENEKA